MQSLHPRLLVAAFAWLAACTSVPTSAIPDPLPETIAWAADGTPQGGAFLGLEVRENSSGSLEALRIDPGVRVTRVSAGSPAEQAGFQVGDVLLGWQGERVSDPQTLGALLAQADADRETRLEVQRGDSIFELPVRLRAHELEQPEARLEWRADPARSRAGWLGGHGGVALVTSDPDGPFPAAGVPVGSVVTHIDGTPQRSERALIRSLLEREPGSRIEVDYRAPDSEPQRATVELYDPPLRVTEAGLPVLAGYRSDASGETAHFYLLDLWFISLFRYRREGLERHYRVLRFITFSTGVGVLGGGRVMFAILLLLFTPALNGTEAHYLDASLDLDGELLSWRFVDLERDGARELILAIGTTNGERELRVHRLHEGGLASEPETTVPILPDVLAWGAADVRSEPGRELLFLTSSGVWSYSLTLPGYRDNVRPLAREELIYDMPDPRALPYWAYVLHGEGREWVLLPGRERLTIWGPATEMEADTDAAYTLRVALPRAAVDDDDEVDDDLEGDGASRGDGPRVSVGGSSPFLPESSSGGSSLFEDAHAYPAPAVLDVNGDGRLDLVVLGKEQLKLYIADDDGPPSEPTRVETLPEALSDKDERGVSLRLRHVDDDGLIDVIAEVTDASDGFENRVHRILVYRGREQSLLRDEPDQVLRFEAGDLEVEVVDVDADGRLDLTVEKLELPSLVGAVTGIEFTFSLLFFPGEERGFARRPALSHEQSFDEESAIELAASREWTLDCNGDGTADLVEIDVKGDITIRCARKVTNRLRGSRWTLDPTPWKQFDVEGSIDSLTVEDVNGDGLGDVISASEERLTVLLSVRAGGKR